MAVESEADRLSMLEDFGETVTLPDASAPTVLWLEPYAEALDVAGSRPGILGRSSDLSSISDGDTIVRDSTEASYRALAPQPDGTGMIRIYLEALS